MISRHSHFVRNRLGLALAVVLGAMAVIVPVALDPSVRPRSAAFLPLVATAIEGMKPVSMALLFVAGAVAGLVGRQRYWLIGAATMGAFPLWSAADLVVGGLRGTDAGHDLLGIEWVIYAVLSLFGVAGSGCARLLRRAWSAPRRPGPRVGGGAHAR